MKQCSFVVVLVYLVLNMSAFAGGGFESLAFSQKSFQKLEGQFDSFSLDENYHSIESVEIQEVEENPYVYEFTADPYATKSLGEVIMVVDQLIALGKKIWPIIEAGKPVVNTNFTAVSVLPTTDGATPAIDLAGWEVPKSKSYRVVYKNLFGMEVIAFTYTVQWQYGGSYNGSGQYLTGVKVTGSNVSVAWGFNFDAKSEVVAITNRGTDADPKAGLTVQVKYIAKSVFKEIRSSNTFHVSGDGQIVRLE